MPEPRVERSIPASPTVDKRFYRIQTPPLGAAFFFPKSIRHQKIPGIEPGIYWVNRLITDQFDLFGFLGFIRNWLGIGIGISLFFGDISRLFFGDFSRRLFRATARKRSCCENSEARDWD